MAASTEKPDPRLIVYKMRSLAFALRYLDINACMDQEESYGFGELISELADAVSTLIDDRE